MKGTQGTPNTIILPTQGTPNTITLPTQGTPNTITLPTQGTPTTRNRTGLEECRLRCRKIHPKRCNPLTTINCKRCSTHVTQWLILNCDSISVLRFLSALDASARKLEVRQCFLNLYYILGYWGLSIKASVGPSKLCATIVHLREQLFFASSLHHAA